LRKKEEKWTKKENCAKCFFRKNYMFDTKEIKHFWLWKRLKETQIIIQNCNIIMLNIKIFNTFVAKIITSY